MEATQKEKACMALMENTMQVDVNWMKEYFMDSSKGSSHISGGYYKNNTMAENIAIRCSLVLLVVSEMEK